MSRVSNKSLKAVGHAKVLKLKENVVRAIGMCKHQIRLSNV